ncbi:MAG: beta-ketoacyl synthase N-terminal-like domain-containing protein [Acidimicrobiia bacterium]|nr:beta-ketoacyl synthase N-terminal-like domain-containing protein [Acidimicrobiia bacterium]
MEDVILGSRRHHRPQAGDIARTCWLAADLPDHVPGTTVDRQCGSAQQAVHFAAQAVMSGTTDLVVAGGVQNMSLPVPISSAMFVGARSTASTTRSPAVRAGRSATATRRSASSAPPDDRHRWKSTREEMEAFALQSHEPARWRPSTRVGSRTRSCPRRRAVRRGPAREHDAREDRSQPRSRSQEGGTDHRAMASQISDASARPCCWRPIQAVEEHGLTPRARVHHLSVYGADPVWMLTAPIPATKRALEKTGMFLDDIDLVEINEAFASVVLALRARNRGRPWLEVNAQRRAPSPSVTRWVRRAPA